MTLKIAVFAPMPRAKVSTAITARPGLFNSARMVRRTSFMRCLLQMAIRRLSPATDWFQKAALGCQTSQCSLMGIGVPPLDHHVEPDRLRTRPGNATVTEPRTVSEGFLKMVKRPIAQTGDPGQDIIAFQSRLRFGRIGDHETDGIWNWRGTRCTGTSRRVSDRDGRSHCRGRRRRDRLGH